MIEPHERAARMSNEPGTAWFHFLAGRFIGPTSDRRTTLAVAVQQLAQQSTLHVDLQGLFERSTGGALPVISEFTGAVNLETREISLHEEKPPREFTGHFSPNGRVLTLREAASAKAFVLVHEDTLAQLV